jgi:hypothetical protein
MARCHSACMRLSAAIRRRLTRRMSYISFTRVRLPSRLQAISRPARQAMSFSSLRALNTDFTGCRLTFRHGSCFGDPRVASSHLGHARGVRVLDDGARSALKKRPRASMFQDRRCAINLVAIGAKRSCDDAGVLTGFLPIVSLNRLAHTRQGLHSVARVQARRIDHVTKPLAPGQTAWLRQGLLQTAQ